MLSQAGLEDYLNNPRRPVTVFAPTNQAWKDVEGSLPQPLTRWARTQSLACACVCAFPESASQLAKSVGVQADLDVTSQIRSHLVDQITPFCGPPPRLPAIACMCTNTMDRQPAFQGNQGYLRS